MKEKIIKYRIISTSDDGIQVTFHAQRKRWWGWSNIGCFSFSSCYEVAESYIREDYLKRTSPKIVKYFDLVR